MIPTMFRQILAVTRKELRLFVRDPGALALTFLMPFMFIVVMSTALKGLFSPEAKMKALKVLVINKDQGPHAAAIVERLDAMDAFDVESRWNGKPLGRQEAERLVVRGKRSLAIVFPPDFSKVLEQSLLAAEKRSTTVEIVVDPVTSLQIVEPMQALIEGLLRQRAAEALMPRGIDNLIAALRPEAGPAETGPLGDQARRAAKAMLLGSGRPPVTLKRTYPRGIQLSDFPDTYQQNVPGYTIFGIFWIVSLLAGSVLRERREGTLRRLQVAPFSRSALLAGKLIPYLLINVIQIAIMLGSGKLIFGMGLGRDPLALALVSLICAATATGLGVMVSALVRTEAQAGSLATLLLLILSALGGCFVPRFVMPEWLQLAGFVTPHAWGLEAYHDLLVRGMGLAQVLPKIGVLAAFAALFFAVGAWRFRYEG